VLGNVCFDVEAQRAEAALRTCDKAAQNFPRALMPANVEIGLMTD